LLVESPTYFDFSGKNVTVEVTPKDTWSGGVPLSRINPSDDSQYTRVGESTWGEESRIWIPAVTIPQLASQRQRTIVLCFDGTGDQFDGDNSNVVQFLSLLKKDDNNEQLVYYQAGIGTYTDPLFSLPVTNGVSLVLDQMLAWNFASHVKDGYAYLMQNYSQGDKICIFGFSRGAYTARALAGMLQKVGLLPLCNHQQLPFAYEMYIREDVEGLALSHMFKRTFCRSIRVEFVGVWDTVASVGIVTRYLPFVHENSGIRYLRHALALDERRVKFLPQFCVEPDHTPDEGRLPQHQIHDLHRQLRGVYKPHKPQHARTLTKAFEDLINKRNAAERPDVLEVWFAGVHTDVGGGSVPNGTRHSLARIPLRWMIRECFRCNTGIIFDAAQLQQTGLRVVMEKGIPVLAELPPRIRGSHLSQPQGGSMPNGVSLLWSLLTTVATHAWSTLKWCFSRPSMNIGALPFTGLDTPDQLVEQAENCEAEEEYDDALSPLNDQLEGLASWHLLEWIPQRVKKAKAIVAKAEDGSSYKWIQNRGRGRKIPRTEMTEGLKVHRSVKTKLEATSKFDNPYIPQVRPNIECLDPDKGWRKTKTDPVQLSHAEWNVEHPQYWEWVE